MRFSAGFIRQLVCSPSKLSVIQQRYSSVAAVTRGKVYELRTYNIWPHHLKAFLNLTTEEFHLRTAQSKLIGYWTSELGGLNEVVHIWEYDSLEHRAQVRLSLANNAEWIQRYFSKILPMMSGQQNSVLSTVPGITFGTSEGKGVYQLQTVNFQLGKDAEKETQALLQNIKSQDGLLVGAFTTLHGNLNTAVLLWKHSTLSSASSFVSQQLKSGESWKSAVSGYSKILAPHQVSPLQ